MSREDKDLRLSLSPISSSDDDRRTAGFVPVRTSTAAAARNSQSLSIVNPFDTKELVSSSVIHDEVEDLEVTLNETIRCRDQKSDEADYHASQMYYALRFCEPSENVHFVGEAVKIQSEKIRDQDEIDRLMKRLDMMKLRQSLTDKLRQQPNKRDIIEPKLDEINAELASLDAAENNKTLDSTLGGHWQDDNYSFLNATNNTRIEYIKMIHYCEPCEHTHETSLKISADCIYKFDTPKIIDQELQLLRSSRVKNVLYNSVGVQKDDIRMIQTTSNTTQQTQTLPKVSKSIKTQTRVQTHEIEIQTVKKRGVESASQTNQNRIRSTSFSDSRTQTPSISLTDATFQTKNINNASIGLQTDDSGIDSAPELSASECQTTNIKTVDEKCQTEFVKAKEISQQTKPVVNDDIQTQTDAKKVMQKSSQIKPELMNNGMNTADIYRSDTHNFKEEPKLTPDVPLVMAKAITVKATKKDIKQFIDCGSDPIVFADGTWNVTKETISKSAGRDLKDLGNTADVESDSSDENVKREKSFSKIPKALKIGRIQDIKRRMFSSNVKHTQTEGVKYKSESSQYILKSKSIETMFKPTTKMVSSQTPKKIYGTKSTQTRDEKQKSQKFVNKCVQTLYDANKLEQLKKEIAKLKNANEDLKIEKLQESLLPHSDSDLKREGSLKAVEIRSMPSTSKLAIIESKRPISHSVRSTEDEDDVFETVVPDSTVVPASMAGDTVKNLEALCKKLQKENNRLIVESKKLQPSNTKTEMVKVKSEVPNKESSSKKTKGKDLIKISSEENLYKKLIDENKRLIKEKGSDELPILCKKLQNENDRLIKAKSDVDVKNKNLNDANKVLEKKINKSPLPEAQERLKEGAQQGQNLYKKLIDENKRLMKEKSSDQLPILCKKLQNENDRLIKAKSDDNVKNKNLNDANKILEKKINKSPLPEAQERLKEGALIELKRAEEKIKTLQKENNQLAQRVKTEQKIKEGVLSEVERLNKKMSKIDSQLLCKKLQEENNRLISKNKDIISMNNEPEVISINHMPSFANIVKSEAPGQKVSNDDTPSDGTELYKKLITENQRLMKNNSSDKFKCLCQELQNENNRLIKEHAEINKKQQDSPRDTKKHQDTKKILKALTRAEEKVKALENEKNQLEKKVKIEIKLKEAALKPTNDNLIDLVVYKKLLSENERLMQKTDDKLQCLCNELQNENDRLMKVNKEAIENLQDLEKTKKILEKSKPNHLPNEQERLKSQLAWAEKKNKALEKEKDQLQKKIKPNVIDPIIYKKLLSENERLMQITKPKDNDNLQNLCNELQKENDRLIKAIQKKESLPEAYDILKHENEQLMKLNKELEYLKDEHHALSMSSNDDDLDCRHRALSSSTKTIDSGVFDNSVTVHDIPINIENSPAEPTTNTGLKQLCQYLQKENQRLITEKTKRNVEINMPSDEVTNLKKKILLLQKCQQDELTCMQDDLDAQESRYQHAHKELAKMREENQILEEDLEDVFKQKVQAESHNKELETFVEALEEDNAIVAQENDRLKKIAITKHVHDNNKSATDELGLINAQLIKENEDLKETLTNDRTKLNQANLEADKLAQDVKELLQREDDRFDDYEGEIKALEQDLENQYTQRVASEKERQEMEFAIDQLRSANQKYADQNAELADVNGKNKDDKNKLAVLEKENKDKLKTNIQTKLKLEELLRRIKKDKDNLHEVPNDSLSHDELIPIMKETNVSAIKPAGNSESCDDLIEEITKFATLQKSYQPAAGIDELKRENSQLKAEYSDLLHKAGQAISDHKKEIKQMENENQDLVDENKAFRKAALIMHSGEKQFSAMDSELVEMLQDENNLLIEDNKALRDSLNTDTEKRQFIVIPSEKPLQADLESTTISELEEENAELQKKVKTLSVQLMEFRNTELETKSPYSPAKRIDQEPYSETAENQSDLKEGVLHELSSTKVKLSKAEHKNEDLEQIMEHLNKKIKLLSTPEAQQRLKDGALKELARAEENIKTLETEKDKLANIAQSEMSQKNHERQLKEGAIAEVERLNEKFLKDLEQSVLSTIIQPITVKSQSTPVKSQPTPAKRQATPVKSQLLHGENEINKLDQSLDVTEQKLTQNEDAMKKLKPNFHELNAAEGSFAQVALMNKLKKEMDLKDDEISKLEDDLNEKQQIINEINGLKTGLQDQHEFKMYKTNKRLDESLAENHSMKHQIDCLNTSYENLLVKNEELKSKIARIRNELELLNVCHTAKVKKFYRRTSDPDLIRIPASERTSDRKEVRNLRNTDEVEIDGEKIPLQNEPKNNTWQNIENMKNNMRELQQRLKKADNKNQQLRTNQNSAQEKCDILETHLNSAARTAEVMNRSFSSSNKSLDKLNETMSDQIRRLRDEMKTSDEENRQLQYDLDNLKKQHNEVKTDLAIANDKIRHLKIALAPSPFNQSHITDTAMSPRNSTTVQTKDFDELYEQYQSALHTIDQQNEQLELASLSSKDADFQSHLEQSQAEYEMYDSEIKELKDELTEKKLLLKHHNVPETTVSAAKYQKLKRELAQAQSKCTQLEHAYDNLKRKLGNSKSLSLGDSINDQLDELESKTQDECNWEGSDKVKFEMINELRYIFNESELATPRDRDGSMNSLSSSGLQGQLEHGIKTGAPNSSNEIELAALNSLKKEEIEDYKRTIEILQDVIKVHRGDVSNNPEYDWTGEILDLTEQNSKLNEDIRRRQDTIDKLVYRYAQSEQKVREFIKNTMRTIMTPTDPHRYPTRDSKFNDSVKSEAIDL